MAIGGRINTGILTGIVVVSCIPTTISSNVVMTRMAGGEPSAAMIEVVIGNVLGPFITPAMTVGFIPKDPTFSSWRPVENFGLAGLYRHVFMQLGLSVLLPLFVGQMIQWAFPVRTKWVVDKFYLTKITFMLCRPPKALRAWDPFPLSPPVHLPKGFSWLGDLVSTKSLFRQLSKRETIAVCFCAAAKTTALGIPMVAVLWKGADNTIRSQIQIPVVLYTTEQIFFAQGFVHLFRWWMRRGDDSEPVVQAPDETDAVQLS
ncbi:MAG: hypothetical protein M1834_005395 [Cirrosporium novae-zelandiae]|nr:MAG: hypothetical protein M1834_005395 [Cirrosporium novae-zelandiae]